MAQDLETKLSEMHQKASDAMAEGEKQKAIDLYNEILTFAPGDEIAHGQLMDLYFEDNKFKYYLMRANYNVVNQKFEHAINDTKKALNIEPDSIDARVKLARLYRVSNKNLKAIDEFNKITELDPKFKDAYIELINLYILEDAKESAVGIAKKATDEFKDDIELKNLLAKLYFDTGCNDLALEVVEDNFLKAKILLSSERNDEAKNVLDTISSHAGSKDAKAAYNLLLSEYYYNKNEYDNALNTIEEYVKLSSPDAVSFQMKALVYEARGEKGDDFMASVNWGYMKKAQGKNDEAVVEFNHAHSINSKDKNVLIELANLYMALGEKYTSMDFWNSVYELDKDPHAKEILGNFYFDEGDYKMAEKYDKYRDSKANPEDKNYAESEEEDEGLIEKIINFFSKK